MHTYTDKTMLNQPAHHNTAENHRGGLRQWLAGASRQWQRRRMIAALHAMDDRLLRDIGLHRGNIESVVDGFDDHELRMTPLAPAATANRAVGDVWHKAT